VASVGELALVLVCGCASAGGFAAAAALCAGAVALGGLGAAGLGAGAVSACGVVCMSELRSVPPGNNARASRGTGSSELLRMTHSVQHRWTETLQA
jgi:hypothetical protein